MALASHVVADADRLRPLLEGGCRSWGESGEILATLAVRIGNASRAIYNALLELDDE